MVSGLWTVNRTSPTLLVYAASQPTPHLQQDVLHSFLTALLASFRLR